MIIINGKVIEDTFEKYKKYGYFKKFDLAKKKMYVILDMNIR